MKKLILIHTDNADFLQNFCVKFDHHINEPRLCMLMLMSQNKVINDDFAHAMSRVANSICADVQAERMFVTNDKVATDAVVELNKYFNVFSIYLSPQDASKLEPSFIVINDLEDIDYAFMHCVSWVFDV